MFAEVKALMPSQISGDDYDAQIVANIYAAAHDLADTADIIIPGNVSISIDSTTGAVTDNSTVDDQYVLSVIALWCSLRIGNPPNYDQLLQAYNSIKANMSRSSRYSNYPE